MSNFANEGCSEELCKEIDFSIHGTFGSANPSEYFHREQSTSKNLKPNIDACTKPETFFFMKESTKPETSSHE